MARSPAAARARDLPAAASAFATFANSALMAGPASSGCRFALVSGGSPPCLQRLRAPPPTSPASATRIHRAHSSWRRPCPDRLQPRRSHSLTCGRCLRRPAIGAACCQGIRDWLREFFVAGKTSEKSGTGRWCGVVMHIFFLFFENFNKRDACFQTPYFFITKRSNTKLKSKDNGGITRFEKIPCRRKRAASATQCTACFSRHPQESPPTASVAAATRSAPVAHDNGHRPLRPALAMAIALACSA